MRELYVKVAVTDVLSQPDPNGAERLTQALLGDRVQIEREEIDWVLGQVVDGYRGWLRRSDLAAIGAKPGPGVGVVKAPVVELQGLEAPASFGAAETNFPNRVYLGTRLVLLGEEDGAFLVALPGGGQARVARTGLNAGASGLAAQGTAGQARPAEILKYALSLRGRPYLWGGVTCSGVDCSGLVYIAYRTAGLLLPRDADQQYAYGEAVVGPLAPADLVFFATEEAGFPSHVGLYLGGSQFLHASSRLGGVVVTSLNAPFYRRCYLGARRVLTGQAGFDFGQGEERAIIV